MVANGKIAGAAKIGVRVGKVINKHKVAKHFDLDIKDGSFAFSINAERVAAEASLNGLYVIRTSVARENLSAEAAVLNYKKLSQVERAFRTLKGVELQVRPIRHRLETRVTAHIFLSMLAYYVEWHMIEAPMRHAWLRHEGGRSRSATRPASARLACAIQWRPPGARRPLSTRSTVVGSPTTRLR